jgi:hypothetical protein
MTRITEIETELAQLRERSNTLSDEWNQLKGQALEARMATLLGDTKDLTLALVMQIDMNELGNSQYGGSWWKIVTSYLDEQCRDGQPLDGLYRGGSNPEAGGQAGFKIKLDQNRPLDEQCGLTAILPLITPVKGWKYLSIFEHTLSAGGSWGLRVSEDGKTAEVWGSRDLRYVTEYGDKRVKPEYTGDVDGALAYLYQWHPYELKKGLKDESEDDW